jgi:beta-glucosidase
MVKTCSFPKNFLWGSATSSYQVEGANANNDWYAWEEQGKVPYRSLDAADSYRRFEEDFDLIKALGQNCHRLSLEWSRIEPAKERDNEIELLHYQQVLSSLKERNINSIVTLHHFTNPLWFYQDNCWLNPKASEYFANYVTKVAQKLSGLVDYWITINEPLVYVYNAYVRGIWPPGEKSLKKAQVVLDNLAKAHCLAFDILHKICPSTPVSIAHNMRIFTPCSFLNLGQNLIPALVRDRLFNINLLEVLIRKKCLDFIGLNYYTRDFVRFSFSQSFGTDCKAGHHKDRKNSLGWNVFPQGLFTMLMRLKRYNLPIIITENGTTEEKDALYEDYLKKHLFYAAKAIEKGAKVTGYLWWSLLDNFEWEYGFGPRFGLAAVGKDFKRAIKPFAYAYKHICETNRIDYV